MADGCDLVRAEYLALMSEAKVYGLSTSTVLAACEDWGCTTPREYLGHIRSVIANRKRDLIGRALAQVGASSAMASGMFGERGR